MKKTISLITIILLATISSFGQSFEGKIIYNNVYKSNLPNVPDAQFSSMMGTMQEYYIKNGNYKTIMNGSLLQSQYYINEENKLYTKMSNSEDYLWNDASINQDEVIKSELNKGVVEILGYKCDELILTCKSGVQKYYFNSKFAIDPKLFEHHKYGNWYDLVTKSKALPLKMIIENEQMKIECTAASITPMKLEASFFALPTNAKTQKSPY